MKKISIIIPVYNEEKTVVKVLNNLTKAKLGIKKEIIIIDDGSTDNSKNAIKSFLKDKKKSKLLEFKFLSKKNGGKGSAVRKGIEIATGEIVTIQDADLEYNPIDLKKLIKPIIEEKEKVVYGSRFLKKHKPLYKIYFLGNKFLTLLTKIFYGTKITDMETCYKVFKSEIIKNIKLKSNNFNIEPEITSKILKLGIKIKEVPISYAPRTIEEGKKINWMDGIHAIFTLFYWKFKKNNFLIHSSKR